MKSVRIELKTGGQTLRCSGEAEEEKNALFLRVFPSQDDPVSSEYRIFRDRVELYRVGEISMRTTFSENTETAAEIVTPYGRFSQRVFTRKLSVKNTDAGVMLELSYTLGETEEEKQEIDLLLSVV